MKVHRPGHKEPVKIPSGRTMTARRMVADVKKVASGGSTRQCRLGIQARSFTDVLSANPTILEAVGSASISPEHSVIPLRWSTMPPCKRWGATKEGACSSWVWALD